MNTIQLWDSTKNIILMALPNSDSMIMIVQAMNTWNDFPSLILTSILAIIAPNFLLLVVY
jgi:hypothetical protein